MDVIRVLLFKLLLFAIFLTASVESKRILLMPFPYSSHVSELKHLGEAMMEKGHQISMFMTKSYPDLESLQKSKIKMILHDNPDPDYQSAWSQEHTDNVLEEMMAIDCITDMRTHIDGFREVCTNALGDDDVVEKMKAMKFDLILVDIFPGSRCFLAVVRKLNVPFIGVTTSYEPWLYRNPALPSFMPFNWGSGKLTEVMTFWERLENLWTIVDWIVAPRVEYLEQPFMDRYLPEKDKGVSLSELVGKAELHFIDSDMAIDYPRPAMPNEILIGGMTTKPAKPLPKDLEDFVSTAKEGVVLVSFGSFGGNLPIKISEKLMTAFSRLPQKVIWRYPHSQPASIPPNVKLLEWMPQNDILGHRNTKAFVTHCGANGQFEGVYNAVPMINFPIFGDQAYNAKRAEYKGIAVTMNLLDFTTDELVSNIKEVIEDPKYRESVIKISKIFKSSSMKPTERAVYWMEHILEFGGKHLRSYALDMPWYQFIMLDIFAFLSVVAIFALYVMVKIYRWSIKRMFKKKAKTQ